jgi:molybdopterin-containing oxidoreductase family iron-sulfur binding subunit
MSTPRRPTIPIAPTADDLARRRFLKLMAASAALAGAGCSGPPAEPIVPYVRMPEGMVQGLPLFYATAFVRRGLAHGVLVESTMGRPTKVEGNLEHPVSGGATDVFAQASVLQVWDPDRSQTVQQGSELSTWAAVERALEERRAQFGRDGGAGLRILTGALTSPTLADQMAALMQRYPNARWHSYDPVHDDGAVAAARIAFGQPVDAVYRLDKAAVVLTLDADLFGAWPGSVRYARDFTERRRRGVHAGANRLYAMESTPTLTGAYADNRLARAPHEIEHALWRIAARLGVPGGAGAAPDADSARWEAAVAGALARAPGRSLVVAGTTLSPASRALVHLLNQRLGAVGNTIDYIAPVRLGAADHGASIDDLARAMHAGVVDTLIMLDVNPVYTAPPELEFVRALQRVPCSVHLGLYRDESARRATWHLPMAHCYEQWSDARAHDGTASIVQPLMAPLYAGRSAHEVLAAVLGEGSRDGYSLVRTTWQRQAGKDFDAFWQEALRRGVVEGSAAAPLAVRASGTVAKPALPARGIVAVFAPDPAVDAGEFANNGWLQELPRPMTQLTWDNAALLGPATAAHLMLATGDVVKLRLAGREISAPVCVVPMHAENAVTLPLGYGRTAAGEVGNQVGFDAYRLRTRAARVGAVVEVSRTGQRHELAFRQHEADLHGRSIVKVADLAAFARAPNFARELQRDRVPDVSLYPEYPYEGYKWGMAIDLNACIGCGACTVACQAENNIPVVGKEEVMRGRSMHWIRVDRYQSGKRTLFQPVPCMHCEDAPCEEVCPVGATMHDGEGLNVQVYNRCVGTRFCSNNCPYKVRRFNFLQYSNTDSESLKALQNPEVTVRRRGVMEKCSYCLQRITRARIDAEKRDRRIADGEMVTACQAVCPTRAISFGDLNDPHSAVVAAKSSPLDYALLAELNTRPRTTYTARVVNPDEELE